MVAEEVKEKYKCYACYVMLCKLDENDTNVRKTLEVTAGVFTLWCD